LFDLAVSTYAGFSLAVEFVLGAFSAFALSEKGTLIAMTSQILHLMGAAAGFAVGVAMLKWRWVDCENWDLFSIMKDRHLMTREQLAQEALTSEEGQQKLAAHRQNLQSQFRNHLSAGEAEAALGVHRRAQIQFGADWQLGEEEHIQLITSLQKRQKWDDVAQGMAEYLRFHTKRAPLVRLGLAQILLERLGRPGQALKVLGKLDPQTLPPPRLPIFNRLREQAERQAAEDPYEIAADDW
jgi:hypothetical protein